MRDIKELIRDPKLYYILVPAVCAIWPLWLALAAMPAAQKQWLDAAQSYDLAEKITLKILEVDPERLAATQNQGKAAQFNYPAAVEQVARMCGIPAEGYKLQTSALIKSQGGQQTQDGDVSLKQIDITTFAKFLATMQLRWADLQCASLKLTKQKGTADAWRADIKFRYYY
jgi:hypothetical protein